MEAYSVEVETKMKRLFGWLSEKDRRRYAAVEAAKLGHGGVEYIAHLLACDPKTIRQGLQELEEPEDAAAGRVRKKGADATLIESQPTLEANLRAGCKNSRQAIRCASARCGRTCRCANCNGD